MRGGSPSGDRGRGGEEEEARDSETATHQGIMEPLVGSSRRSSAAEVTPVERGMGSEAEVGPPSRPPRPPSDGQDGAARRKPITYAKNERRVRIALSH